MKKSLVVCFVIILLFSITFISASHRQDVQEEKFYLDKWLNNLWGKVTGQSVRTVPISEIQTIQRQPLPGICVSVDSDGDSYFPASRGCPSPYDCDDANSNINPGVIEICNNNFDDNCDGQIDEGCIKEIAPIRQKPISLEPLEPITCVDSDGGINYDTKGIIEIQVNGQPVTFTEACTIVLNPGEDPNKLTEFYCNGNEMGTEIYTCLNGCSNGICIIPSLQNLQISLATLKDKYNIGEQIKLTDPPETGDVVVEQDNSLNRQSFQGQNFIPPSFSLQGADSDYSQFNIIQDGQVITRPSYSNEFVFDKSITDPNNFLKQFPQEFNGYIVEFEKEPIIAEKIRLTKKAEEKIQATGRAVDDSVEFKNNFLLISKKIDNKVEKYSVNLKKDNQKIEQKIIKELSRIKEKPIEIEKEFTIAFNGAVLKESLTQKEIEEIERIKGVKKVWPNVKVYPTLMDSVPLINADDVWQMQDGSGNYLTGEGIKIGIIDTGIDYAHPDLGSCYGVGCKVVDGYDFSDLDSDPMDYMGHGTHVAATAAGNGILKGVAPDAELYAYKVFPNSFSEVIISAIERCADPNEDGDYSDYLDVCSLSLGGYGNPDDPMSTAIDSVTDLGVVFTIAAGNSGCENCIGSPGTARKAITVAASDKSDAIAGFSSRGPVVWTDINGIEQALMKPDITAPGVSICAAQWDSAWQDRECLDTEHTAISGTSMATPHVAGVVALIKQAHPNWTPDEIKMALRNTAVDIGENIITQGQGRVDTLSVVNSQKPVIAEFSEINYNPSGLIDIYGTAKGGNPVFDYGVYYSVKDSGNWNLICSGYTEVDNGILCSNFNVDNLIDDKYLLKLVVYSHWIGISEDYGVFEIDNVKILNPLNGEIYRAGDVVNINLEVLNSAYNFQSVEIKDSKTEVSLGSVGINIVNDELATWDTSSLNDGVYDLVLTFEFNGDYFEERVQDINLDSSFRGAINVGTNGEIFGELTLTDFDEDGLKEIVLKGNKNAYVYNQDGSLKTGWPQYTDFGMSSFPYSLSFPLIADVDNDGNKEIFSSWGVDYGYNEYVYGSDEPLGAILYGWNYDGSPLPGFPIQYQSLDYNFFFSPFTSPISSDINNDGSLEIIFGNLGSYYDYASNSWVGGTQQFIFVWDSQGQLMPGWPIELSLENNPAATNVGFLVLTVANLDDTSQKEIIVSYPEFTEGIDSTFVFDFEGNLKKSLDISSYGSLSLADINDDGKLEINNRFNAYMKMFNFDEEIWSIGTLAYSIYSGSFGDLNNDEIPEIVIGSNSDWGEEGSIYIFNSLDGSILNSWPISDTGYKWSQAQEIIADINNDGNQDIIANVITSDGNQLYAWDSSGNILNGFPKNLGADSYSFTSPAIDDIDDDGKLEILVYVWKFVEDELNPGWYLPLNKILIFDLDSPYNPEKMDWPMFMHDPQHTGCYNCESARPQSKIVNNENADVTGTLTMKLQKKTEDPLIPLTDCALWFDGCNKCQVTDGEINGCTRKYCVEYQESRCLEAWQDDQIVTNEQTTIPSNNLIKLDVGGNYGWNLKDVKANSEGDYRVYASFEFNGHKVENSWGFAVPSSGPVPVEYPVE